VGDVVNSAMMDGFQCLLNCFFEFDFAIVFAFVWKRKCTTFALAAGSATNLACNVVIIESNAEAFHEFIMAAF